MNIDLEKVTLTNENYREVIYTDKFQQLVLMSIPAGEDIPLEIHDNTSQFIRVEKGMGEIRFGEDEKETINIKDGSGIMIPMRTYHHVVNTGLGPLKLYTIYSPPEHYPNRIDKVKPVTKINFTGHKDADILIMMELDDESLDKFCKTNKYIKSICDDDMFWKQKVTRDGAKIDKPTSKTWKEYYFDKYYIPELTKQDYTFAMAPKLKKFLSNPNYFTTEQIAYIQDLLDKYIMNRNILQAYIIIYMVNQNMIFYHGNKAFYRPDSVIRNLFIKYNSDYVNPLVFSDLILEVIPDEDYNINSKDITQHLRKTYDFWN